MSFLIFSTRSNLKLRLVVFLHAVILTAFPLTNSFVDDVLRYIYTHFHAS